MKDKMPSLLGTYARLLLIRRRGLRAGEHLPRLHIECRSLCFEARKIAAYRRVCPGWIRPRAYRCCIPRCC